MRKKLTALILGGLIAGSMVLPLAACSPSGKLPEWDKNVTLTRDGAKVTWDEVEGAAEYKVYHSPSRFGKYTLENTQTKCVYTNADKYGYYRVEAVDADGKVISEELYSYDLDTFGKNTHIYAATDDPKLIQADYDYFKDNTAQFADKELYETIWYSETNEDGEEVWKSKRGEFIGEGRYAGLFKKGKYNDLNLQMRYYMTVSGLDYTPAGVEIGGFYTKGELSGGNATCNFWCGIDNATINSDVQWAVSQATSFRRMQVNGNLSLHDTGATPWCSGGFISDTVVTGTIDGGYQQQWFTRNSQWGNWVGSDINMVFAGCEGKFENNSYVWPQKYITNLAETRVMAEKPYLVFDKEYFVALPDLKTDSKGISWKNDNIDYAKISLDKFYVARSDRDNAETLNAALKKGKHILLTPGIYDIETPLLVKNKDTIVMGLGLATLKLAGKNTDTIMRVRDVDGVRLSGIMFDAGANSQTLLQIGEKTSSVRHNANPTVLNDVYYRIGGAGSAATSVDVTLEINSNDVVGDNFWVWRADHGNRGTVGWDINKTKNGVVVNGDYVTIYGLMVEHFHEYQTIWNGENGFMAFYQSETPYDVPLGQQEWMSEWNGNTYQGYASYKVSDDVQNHEAHGIGVYHVSRNGAFILDHGIELPSNAGIHVEHMGLANFTNTSGGGIRFIVNDQGTGNIANSGKPHFTSFIGGVYKEK